MIPNLTFNTSISYIPTKKRVRVSVSYLNALHVSYILKNRGDFYIIFIKEYLKNRCNRFHLHHYPIVSCYLNHFLLFRIFYVPSLWRHTGTLPYKQQVSNIYSSQWHAGHANGWYNANVCVAWYYISVSTQTYLNLPF